ncbi:MAG: cupin domain-containing protein [Gemmatimonadetes bacterium]|nr:MAG: cupin domain-containing protein [Gemmatimonadota bacterium]
MHPISRPTADHYVWGGTCDGWHLVRSASLSVIEERMPPATHEARHRHAHARQFFYVLSGTLTLEVEGTRHVLGARAGLELPPGAAHQAINESAADVEFLVVSTPPSHGDRIAADHEGDR